MISPKDYISKKTTQKAHFYIHDIFNHLMNAPEAPCFGLAPGDRQDRLNFHREIIQEEMARPTEDRRDLNEELNTFEHRRRHKERDADTGNFDVDRYLDGDQRPFNDVFTETAPKPARTILLDMGIMFGERDGDEMRRRHRYIYQEAIKAEMEGAPLRVIACFENSFTEAPTGRRIYITIKDYTDPIFPEIWSTLKTNASTNSTLNLVIYCLMGTKDTGNGHTSYFEIDDDFSTDEEIILIDPVKISTRKGKVIQTQYEDTPAPSSFNPYRYTPPRRPTTTYRPRRRRIRRRY